MERHYITKYDSDVQFFKAAPCKAVHPPQSEPARYFLMISFSFLLISPLMSTK